MRYDSMLCKKNALITFGLDGAGAALECARLFALHGAAVALAGSDSGSCADAAAEIIKRNREGRVLSYPKNLSDPGGADGLFDWLAKNSFAPCVWLNVANEPFHSYAAEMDDEGLQKRVLSAISLADAVMRRFVKIAQGGGSAAHVCGESALTSFPGISGAAAAQGGLCALALAHAKIYAPQGIRVNAILAGMNVGPNGRRDTQLIPRRGEFEDVAGLALFLLSEMSGRTSGEAVFLDGGKHIIPENNTFMRRRREKRVQLRISAWREDVRRCERGRYGVRNSPKIRRAWRVRCGRYAGKPSFKELRRRSGAAENESKPNNMAGKRFYKKRIRRNVLRKTR